MTGEVITLTDRQWQWLLEGLDIEKMQGHKPLEYSTVF